MKRYCAVFTILAVCIVVRPAAAQIAEHGIGESVDSLHVTKLNMDSLLKADSILELQYIQEERRLDNAKKFATQREIDLTYDGKPETMRLEAKVETPVDKSVMTFTIRSGRKQLYKKSWLAKGYFDTIDHLTDSMKRRRLRRTVTVFFANENFSVLDSADFASILKEVVPADIKPGSTEAHELFSEPRITYGVFQSRDFWYGLVWLPSKKAFVTAWTN